MNVETQQQICLLFISNLQPTGWCKVLLYIQLSSVSETHSCNIFEKISFRNVDIDISICGVATCLALVDSLISQLLSAQTEHNFSFFQDPKRSFYDIEI